MKHRLLAAKYPHLYISEDLRAVWVADEDGRDGTAIYYGNLALLDLDHLEIEATQSLQPGWFFCTGHHKAEKLEEFSFYHFAAKYCKTWAKDHPADEREARMESYE